jgi:hypothetical protein
MNLIGLSTNVRQSLNLRHNHGWRSGSDGADGEHSAPLIIAILKEGFDACRHVVRRTNAGKGYCGI